MTPIDCTNNAAEKNIFFCKKRYPLSARDLCNRCATEVSVCVCVCVFPERLYIFRNARV